MVTWIKEGVGVLEAAVNIGVVNKKESSFLIDTGIDNSAINKVLKNLDFEIDGALITHHHADHMGGCNKLQSLGINNLYGPSEELELIHNPYLEPFTMFGGGHPPKKLRNRHLEAKPAKEVETNQGNPFGHAVYCPGHSPGHTAYIVDDVLFSGDAAFTEDTIDKYRLLFAVNPHQAATSLKNLEAAKFSTMIPGHGPIAEDRKTAIDVLRATEDHYQSIRETVLASLSKETAYIDYIPLMLGSLGIENIVSERGVTQYFLYQVPLYGYLSNLLDDKIVSTEVKNGKLMIVLE